MEPLMFLNLLITQTRSHFNLFWNVIPFLKLPNFSIETNILFPLEVQSRFNLRLNCMYLRSCNNSNYFNQWIQCLIIMLSSRFQGHIKYWPSTAYKIKLYKQETLTLCLSFSHAVCGGTLSTARIYISYHNKLLLFQTEIMKSYLK